MKSFYLSSLFLAAASARTITVRNACSFTIWPALFTDPSINTAIPNQPTGWQAAPNTQVSFTVPDTWAAGRIWGRRYCDFTTAGTGSCLDGGCNGGLLCNNRTGTGAPPVTFAEFTLQTSALKDFYDVSIVDGFNLPMKIDNNKGCPTKSCPVDLIPNCPSDLKAALGPSGSPIGCNSACVADVGGDPADSPACCTGSHNTPATCPPSGVPSYSFFKGNCPRAIVFPYDEVSGSIFSISCSADLKADYTVTFCP
ncbi:thaumatin-like protein [Panaeolus papilionaceus]|nr:thaumatin-like protein [Panaeolus papilionaceus]